MRMSPPLGLVLVAAVTLLASANANAETSLRIDPDTATAFSSSSSYRFGTTDRKDRDQVIAGMEASLLSLLGLAKRPRPQGQAYIPHSLRELYDRQNAIGIADIAKPGIHARSANTVRSFPHIGKLDHSDLYPGALRLEREETTRIISKVNLRKMK
ncbi:protein decapentaplegic-like [Temnothorax curvispinosus]|uniref:Protein decapentaplegic-like n=1 Tax=Temnothorax curvispinosus TaxID=300111 RepID=A0A6J1R393_9HYME|nr:protein decapentaplegic-like [Temnothorax curvispinosus]